MVQVTRTLEAVRGRRQDLEVALGQLERAIAAPVRAAEWVPRVRSELSCLSASFAQHVKVTEEPGQLHEEILQRAPRLARMVDRLQEDHKAIQTAIDQSLAALPSDAAIDQRIARVRRATLALLGRLARHGQLGADLIYEAYSVDIGAGE